MVCSLLALILLSIRIADSAAGADRRGAPDVSGEVISLLQAELSKARVLTPPPAATSQKFCQSCEHEGRRYHVEVLPETAAPQATRKDDEPAVIPAPFLRHTAFAWILELLTVFIAISGCRRWEEQRRSRREPKKQPSRTSALNSASMDPRKDDWEMLMQAALHDDAPTCERLLRRQTAALLRREDAWGCTALHAAAQAGAAAAAGALVSRGCPPDARDAWDETPLHFAARAGWPEVCKLLLESNAQVNLQNADDRTPLVLAADAGHEAVCEMLLQHGAGAGDLDDSQIPQLLSKLLILEVIGGLGGRGGGRGGDAETDSTGALEE